MATKYTFNSTSSVDTWARFLAWAGGTQGVSFGFSTLGFTVPSNTATITSTATAGGSTTYTYSGSNQFVVGQVVTVSGYSAPNTGNNVGPTAITAISGTTTFTVVNGSGTSLTTGSPIVTFQDPYAANCNTATWANGTTNSALSNPVVIPTTQTASVVGLIGTAFPTSSVQARAGLAASHFKGQWVSGTTYAVGDVVSYLPSTGGVQTFMLWANNSGSPTVPPASSASSVTFWTPYWFDIWLMHNAGLSGADVYIKIEYGCGSATVGNPDMSIQFGTAWNGNGCVNATGNFTVTEQIVHSAVTFIASTPASYMCSDGQNYFSMLMWSGATSQGSCIVAFERSISGGSSGPTYNNNYLTYCVNTVTNTEVHQNSLLVNISGAAWTSGTGFTNTAIRLVGCSAVNLNAALVALVVGNATPALPVFPLVGWVGNPLTVVVGLTSTDAVEGAFITPTIYGNTVNYVVSKITSFNGFGSGTSGAFAVGVKYQ